MNVKRQYDMHRSEYNYVITKAAESGKYIGGIAVEEFEKNFSKYMKVKHAISCGSGTDALVIALRALNIGEGDEVITTAFTFFATVESIVNVGATPVFVDVEKDTFCIDPHKIEEKITSRTKAILPVHLYGNSADMDAIKKIANRYKLRIITDCAQATGTKYKGERKNILGDIGCFSFFPTKNLGGIGDGGMILTDDDSLALACKSYRAHGSGIDFEREYQEEAVYDKYHNHHIGYNSRLDAIQATFLNKRLDYLDDSLKERRSIANFYFENLDVAKYSLPKVRKDIVHSYYFFALQNIKAKKIMEILNDKGIESKTYYPVPAHLQKALSYLNYKQGSLPVTEQLCNTTFGIPVYPGMTYEEKAYVVCVLNSINPNEV